jgi:DNA replication ATP-dependent helicase Dna2
MGAQNMRSEIWSMTAEDREAVGRCFSLMKIVHETTHTSEEGVNLYEYVFQKTNSIDNRLSKSTISVGDAIVVSQDHGPYGLSIGFVVELTNTALTVSVDHSLSKGNFGHLFTSNSDKIYRIDKDELMAGVSVMRYNVFSLFTATGDQKRRELIVDLVPPKFIHLPIHLPDHCDLNPDQKKALIQVARAQDYALILGMPGNYSLSTYQLQALAKQKPL